MGHGSALVAVCVFLLLAIPTPALGERPALDLGLRERVDASVVEEIELLEALVANLDRHDCAESLEPRRRLADLRWEQSKRLFFRLEGEGADDDDELRRAMETERERSLDGYFELVADCPDHGESGRVRLLLGSALVEAGRFDAAADQFRAIIRTAPPGSPWLGNAWLMLGLHFFDHENDASAAGPAFERAEALGDPITAAYARFMRGWCAINDGAWTRAAEHFERVVRGDGAAALRREALGDYVRALSHLAGPGRAWSALVELAGREQAPALMEKLAGWYAEAGEHTRVVGAYQHLIAHEPNTTRLPIYWSRLVETLAIVDRAAALGAARELRGAFVRTRARARSADPARQRRAAKDLVAAREIAERTLRQLAAAHHRDAVALHGRGKRRMLRAALVYYEIYLELFPRPEPGAESDLGMRMRFNCAEALAAVGETERAVEVYESLIPLAEVADDSRKAGEARSRAIETTVHLLQELVRTDRRTGGGRDTELSDHLLRACDRYLSHFGSDRPGATAVAYLAGYLRYQRGQLEDALRVFDDVVRRAPGHDNACHAANLILDILNGQAVWDRLQDRAHAFRTHRGLACSPEERRRFLTIEQTAAGNWIEAELVARQRDEEAAVAYRELARRFVRTRFAAEALVAAGNAFDRAGQPEQALAAWREVAAASWAPETLVRDAVLASAGLLERTVQFARAARELERFARRFPQDARSRDALFNAVVYRSTLGHDEEANRNRRTFVSRYATDPAAPALAFEVCESLGEKKPRGSCFAAFASNREWQRRDPDRACVARARQLGIAELRRWWSQARRGGTDLPRCAAVVAELELSRSRSALDEYRALRIAEANIAEPRARQRFQDSLRAKARARDALVARYQRIVELGAPRPALAALFFVGVAHRDAAAKTLAARIPTEVDGVPLPEDLCEKLRAKLLEIATPSEQAAVETFRACVREAERLGLYGGWRERALAELRALRPLEFRAPETHRVAIRLDDRLRVVENGFVVPDNGGWRGVEIDLR